MTVILPILSGFLLYLSFPGFGLSFAAWAALVPLLLALRGRGPVASFGMSFLFGLTFHFSLFFWIHIVAAFNWTDYLALGLYLAFYSGLFGLILALAERGRRVPAVIAAPSIWVAVEYLRANAGFLEFPLAHLAHSQHSVLPVIQMSSVTGVYGVSFLVVMVNVALRDLALWGGNLMRGGRIRREETRRSPGKRAAVSSIVTTLTLGAVLTYGYLSIAEGEEGGESLRVTVIQPNIPEGEPKGKGYAHRLFARHEAITREALAEEETSLVVWPEGAVYGVLRENASLYRAVGSLTRDTGAYLLTGGSMRPKFGPKELRKGKYFNSAFLVTPEGRVAGRYNKIKLLTFAEYLPHEKSIPWPSWFVLGSHKYLPGEEATIFEVEGARFGVLICWETFFPDLFRKFVKNGAQFALNITNEAWFGETAAPYQFLSMSVFRAVENGIAVVRCGNTGVSCFIDPSGRIVSRVEKGGRDIFVAGFLTAEVLLRRRETFYTRYGDLFAFASIFIALLAILSAALPRSEGGSGEQGAHD
jgi:apolipoprotein N-acyltransferase